MTRDFDQRVEHELLQELRAAVERLEQKQQSGERSPFIWASNEEILEWQWEDENDPKRRRRVDDYRSGRAGSISLEESQARVERLLRKVRK